MNIDFFWNRINFIRDLSPQTLIEILVPDFRGRLDVALEIISKNPPDVFNHNLETVPSLYPKVRPGSDYEQSLDLLKNFKEMASPFLDSNYSKFIKHF